MKSYTVDGQHNAVNLGLWSSVTPWACWRRGRLGVCKTRQILVSGRTSKRLRGSRGLESSSSTQPPERITMRPGMDNRQGNVLCSRTHAFAVSWGHDGVGRSASAVCICRSLSHAANFESQNVLPRQTAAVARQKRAERSFVGTWNLHASSHRLE